MIGLEACWLKLRNLSFYEKAAITSFLFIFTVLSFDSWFENLPLSGYGIIFLSLLLTIFTSLLLCHGYQQISSQSWWMEMLKNKEEKFINGLFSTKIQTFQYPTTMREQIRLLIKDIEREYVKTWYAEISTDPSFLFDCHLLLDEVFFKVFKKLKSCQWHFLTRDVLLLYLNHIQELNRSRRRSRDGDPRDIEEIYRFGHPGSASDKDLNYYLSKVLEVILREHAPHDFANSLISSLVRNILARKLLKTLLVNVEDPIWISLRLLYFTSHEKYLEITKNGSYFLREVTEPEPERKPRFQMNSKILTRKPENIFQRGFRMPSDKNSLKLPLAESNISSVLGNLISSTAAPLLPENVSYQPLNKMWLSPVTELKQEITDQFANLKTLFKNEEFLGMENFLVRSQSSEAISPESGRPRRDISIGEDLAGVMAGKKLTKTQSFDAGSCGDPAEAAEEIPGNVSPVYEETEDFATTIAKLRNVLQQKESTSTASDNSARSIESQDTFSRGNTLDKQDYGCDEPAAASEIPTDGRPIVDVCISGTEVKESSGSSYVLYTIEYNGIYLKQGENGETQLVLQPTTIKRRFQEFLNLQSRLEENPTLRAHLKGIKGPTKWLSSPFNAKTDDATTSTRRPVLERYLKDLCDRVELATCPALHEFLAYGSAPVTTFGSSDSNSSLQKIDKFLSNKVTGVFNSIKTALPSFDGSLLITDGKEMKEKPAIEQNLLQGFLNFGNRTEDVPPISLNFLIAESTGDSLADSIRRFLARKSDCIEDALDVLDNSDWHSEQGECHVASLTGSCVWSSYRDSHMDDYVDKIEATAPLSGIFLDIVCELLGESDCWITKEPVICMLKRLFAHWEQEFKARLCESDWDRICANILRVLRNAVFSKFSSTSLKLDFHEVHKALFASIVCSVPVPVIKLLGQDSVESAINMFLGSFKFPGCNRDVLLRFCDLLITQLLSCPHLSLANA